MVDGGEMGSRRHLNIRGKSANLPAITERDWKDIEFGVKMEVDFYALSFVRDAECIYELQEYLRQKGSTAKVRWSQRLLGLTLSTRGHDVQGHAITYCHISVPHTHIRVLNS